MGACTCGRVSLSPLEALEIAELSAIVSSLRHPPGGIIKRLCACAREALEGLTSDMARNQRLP